MPLEPTDAHRFEGLDLTTEAWFPLLSSEPHGTVLESVHMVYGSGLESNKTVKEIENVNITIIRPFWFAAFGLKLVLVSILAVTSLIMRNQGYTPVAHDELRLAQLLRRRIEETDPGLALLSTDETPAIYLNNTPPQPPDATGYSTSGRVRVYAAGRPLDLKDKPRISGGVVQIDPNFRAHAAEALCY